MQKKSLSSKRTPPYHNSGFSLLEVLVSMTLLGLLTGMAISNLKDLDDPLQDGASQVLGYIKQVRAQAISSTQAYFIQASSTTQITSSFGIDCQDPSPVLDDRLFIDLPTGVQMTNTSWTFCFSTRGLADSNILIPLQDQGGSMKVVEVLLGGAARVQ